MITSRSGCSKSSNSIHLRHKPPIGPSHCIDPVPIYKPICHKCIDEVVIIFQVWVRSVCAEVSEVEVVVGSFTGAWGDTGRIVYVSSLDGDQDETGPSQLSAQIKYSGF